MTVAVHAVAVAVGAPSTAANNARSCSTTAVVISRSKRSSALASVAGREAGHRSLVGHVVRVRKDGSMATTAAMVVTVVGVKAVRLRMMHCGRRSEEIGGGRRSARKVSLGDQGQPVNAQ